MNEFFNLPYNKWRAALKDIPDVEGYLLFAIKNYKGPFMVYSKFDVLIERTTDFTGCLIAAIENIPYDEEFLNKIIDVTTDYSGCLLAAITGPKRADEPILERLYSLTDISELEACRVKVKKKYKYMTREFIWKLCKRSWIR